MGDDRKPYDYEMAPQSEGDVEKGKLESPPEDEKKSNKSEGNEWGGLNKAQLLEVADTPFWNWTRNILLILFWIGWVAMLIAAIVIVVKVPRCPEVEWWEKSVFYRVFPQSFKDSNGDGYGDLQGLTKKLDYVKGIGAEVLVLSSIFKQRDNGSRDLGQDIVNFTDVDTTLGNLTDFSNLMTAAGNQELKVILEFVPNHSSDKHPWFQASINKTGNYTDYYVWRDCESTNPPNDWLNKYGDSAWTYNADRGQCYYHYLLPEQPDLNYDNPEVVAEMEDALQFWFDRGVDGFVFSGVDYIFETKDVSTAVGNRLRRQADSTTMAAAHTPTPTPTPTPSQAPTQTPSSTPSVSAEPEPEPTVTGGSGNGMSEPQYSCVGDGCTMNQKKLHELLVRFRAVFNTNSYLGKYRLMVAETEQAPEAAVLLYGNKSREADLVLYKGFANSIMSAPSAQSIKEAVNKWITAREVSFENRWNTWTFGDEDISRIATRASAKFASALNVILLTLPGTPITYYGEELGTPDLTDVPPNKDPVADVTSAPSRDPQRGPMFWANTTTGNFTNGTAWLPIPSDPKYSVEVQDMDDMSVLSAYKELTELHQEPSITAGTFDVITTAPDSIYAYIRQFPGWPGYLVVVNFGESNAKLDFEVKIGDKVISEVELQLKSTGDVEKNEKVILNDYDIKSGEALVFEF